MSYNTSFIQTNRSAWNGRCGLAPLRVSEGRLKRTWRRSMRRPWSVNWAQHRGNQYGTDEGGGLEYIYIWITVMGWVALCVTESGVQTVTVNRGFNISDVSAAHWLMDTGGTESVQTPFTWNLIAAICSNQKSSFYFSLIFTQYFIWTEKYRNVDIFANLLKRNKTSEKLKYQHGH